MIFALFFLSAVGLVLLIICIYIYVAPYVGWKHKYDASIVQSTVDVPRAGSYSLNIRRDRIWSPERHGNISNGFPEVSFSITTLRTGETVKFSRSLSLFTSRVGTVGTITFGMGYFDASTPGKYLITSQPESPLMQNEEIVVLKYISNSKKALSMSGIIIGSLMFMGGLIFGILLLTENL